VRPMGEMVSYAGDGGAGTGYLALPGSGSGSGPGVIVIQARTLDALRSRLG
jgi:dienelactone hydrolase